MKIITIKKMFLPMLIFSFLGCYLFNELSNQFLLKVDNTLNNSSYILIGSDLLMAIYIFTYYSKINRYLFKWVFILLFSITVSSYLTSFFYGFSSISLYFKILLPLLTLLFFNIVLNKIDSRSILIILLLILSALIAKYFFEYNSTYVYLATDNLITNSAYFLLLFLPITLCINNKVLKYIYLALILLAVLYSTKRGGIIAMGGGLLVYLFLSNLEKKRIYRLILFLISSLIIVFLAYYFFVEVNNSNTEYLINRFLNMADDGGSGRTTIFANTFNMILTSDFPSIFLGHGWNSVLRDSTLKISAHNDFLEVFYDFGLIVFLFYMYYFIALIKRLFKMIKTKSKYAGQFACALFITLVFSTISHIVIYPSLLTITIIVFTYIDYIDYESRNFSISISN